MTDVNNQNCKGQEESRGKEQWNLTILSFRPVEKARDLVP